MEHPEEILLERDGPVAIVTLNRPERMNAVGTSTLSDLAEREQEVREDDSIRAVVLTGAGRAFCAGADLSPDAQAKVAEKRTPLRERLPINPETGWPVSWFGVNIPKPVVCAINGAAVGYGAELVATADVRIASERGRIGWVFARRGLVTDMAAGPIILPRLMSLSRAARLLYSGEIIGADEAFRIGLVDEVVPGDELLPRAIALANELAAGAPASIATHKRQLYDVLWREPRELYLDNLDAFERSMESQDFKEGVQSFLEKREARWTGRAATFEKRE